MIGGLREALRIARDEPELRVRLWENVRVMHGALVAQGVDVGTSTSQVIPVLIRNDRRIFDVARELMREGVYLNPVCYPAVKRNQSRLRVSNLRSAPPSGAHRGGGDHRRGPPSARGDHVTRYGFRQALGAFFLAETSELRRHLPRELYPIEVHPGQAVAAVTAFDFVESEVGAYGEIVISAIVPPFAPRGTTLPDAAFFPLTLATTTPVSRRHASERWNLPEHSATVDIDFSCSDDAASVRVSEEGREVLWMRVGRRRADASSRLYQAFSCRDGLTYRVPIRIEGALDEHEEELGAIELGNSSLVAVLAAALEDPTPFREQYMSTGAQHFQDLVPHLGAQR